MNNLYARPTSQLKSLIFLNPDLSSLLSDRALNAVRFQLSFFKQPLTRSRASGSCSLPLQRRPADRSEVGSTGTEDIERVGETIAIDDNDNLTSVIVIADSSIGASPDDKSARALPYVASHPALTFNLIRAPGAAGASAAAE